MVGPVCGRSCFDERAWCQSHGAVGDEGECYVVHTEAANRGLRVQLSDQIECHERQLRGGGCLKQLQRSHVMVGDPRLQEFARVWSTVHAALGGHRWQMGSKIMRSRLDRRVDVAGEPRVGMNSRLRSPRSVKSQSSPIFLQCWETRNRVVWLQTAERLG